MTFFRYRITPKRKLLQVIKSVLFVAFNVHLVVGFALIKKKTNKLNFSIARFQRTKPKLDFSINRTLTSSKSII
jgi:hypothetical protein